MEPFVETILHTDEQKVSVKKDEFGTITMEIVEVADSSSKTLYLTKLEAIFLVDILQNIIDKTK